MREKKPAWHKYIMNSASKAWRYSAVKKEALKRAKARTGKPACAHCGNFFFDNEVQVDHINPSVPVTGWDSWDGYFKRRLDVTVDGLQVLCKPCHEDKSNAENAKRRKAKSRK